MHKVRPMFEALRGYDAWITALRRDSSPTRANAPFVDQYEIEPGRWMVKINPMATWTHQQVWSYLKEHDLPHNPLYDLGYSSIGCAPCTRIRFAGEPERAGRWAGKPKWECGIHTDESAQQPGYRAWTGTVPRSLTPRCPVPSPHRPAPRCCKTLHPLRSGTRLCSAGSYWSGSRR